MKDSWMRELAETTWSLISVTWYLHVAIAVAIVLWYVFF